MPGDELFVDRPEAPVDGVAPFSRSDLRQSVTRRPPRAASHDASTADRNAIAAQRDAAADERDAAADARDAERAPETSLRRRSMPRSISSGAPTPPGAMRGR